MRVKAENRSEITHASYFPTVVDWNVAKRSLSYYEDVLAVYKSKRGAL